MEEFKTLVASRKAKKNTTTAPTKKDKLEQTKKRNSEIKAALKEVRENKKNEKYEEKAVVAHIQKIERMQEHPDSKRAQKDVRQMQRRDRRKSGESCDHGVWKCKICFPPVSSK